MTKEQIDKILGLDCRVEGSMEKLQKVLCNIPPLKKYKDAGKMIPLVDVEKVVRVVTGKYCLDLQQLNMTILDSNESWYSASVRETEKYEWIGNVYGVTLYETWCKLAIKAYTYVKMNDVKTREELLEERSKMGRRYDTRREE